MLTFAHFDGSSYVLLTSGATIKNSELTQIGDSPIAMWGYTTSEDKRSPPGTGIDGSNGNQPRGTLVVSLC